MLVWLTDWQIAEDHVLVELGDVVNRTVYPADAEWITRLFGGHLALEWQYDTYGGAVVQASRRVQGRVSAVKSVRCRQMQSDEGIVPVPGAARLCEAEDTSASWVRGVGPSRSDDGVNHGWRSYSRSFDGAGTEVLYGYVVTIHQVWGDATSSRLSSP
jgi:hypothetical protein